ncbi:MAG: hypothetical protein NWF04_09080 [Candidatus Bathyarchaeota archaeon]|nr:hypothetical protein [Candidatus Bathyarchaeota archaeon]
MFGFYENFPQGTHLTQTLTSTVAPRSLQRKLTKVFLEINQATFSFEEVCNPTVPNCTLIFEFGIAEEENFNYLTIKEAKKLQTALSKATLHIMDWFCSIRYYKNAEGKKTPLKFDYYMLRVSFADQDKLEIQVFHEKGLRYVGPEDLINFVVVKINETSKRKILRLTQD